MYPLKSKLRLPFVRCFRENVVGLDEMINISFFVKPLSFEAESEEQFVRSNQAE